MRDEGAEDPSHFRLKKPHLSHVIFIDSSEKAYESKDTLVHLCIRESIACFRRPIRETFAGGPAFSEPGSCYRESSETNRTARFLPDYLRWELWRALQRHRSGQEVYSAVCA